MKNFEIGEKVKCIDRYGLQNIKIGKFYTVIGYRENGLVILDEFPDCAYDQTFFKPIKEQELKIPTNKIKITVDDLYVPNTINCAELYEKCLLGKFNKKEGNKMIESINLIDLYANKHRESIEKETKEKVEELRKRCDVINKYNELVKQFEKDCDELYLSQFTEEEKNKMLLNSEIAFDNYKPLRERNIYNGPINSENHYFINFDFKNEEIERIESDMTNKIEEINDLVKTVKAHVGIAKTKEEVEEILTRYGIIDKKGKLVIK